MTKSSNFKEDEKKMNSLRDVTAEEADKIISREDVQKLVRLLSYMRPSGNENDPLYREFLELYIEPYFGKPDKHGNYIRIINDVNGNHPRIAYMAHHDTVHNKCGKQNKRIVYSVYSNSDIMLSIDNPKGKMIEKSFTVKSGVDKGKVKTYMVRDPNDDDYSNCLGADCTTGIWLILEMIESGCPGVYVIHAGEEIGCMGSTAIVEEYVLLPEEEKEKHWISKIDIAMSFDRYGETSIITHQMGSRTASDEFSDDLSNILGPKFDKEFFDRLEKDNGGAYTDSNEYSDLVSECTNISVGYYNQHSEREQQNVSYLLMLRDALIEHANDLNDSKKLGAYRDPTITESLYQSNYGYRFGSHNNNRQSSSRDNYFWNDDYYDNYDGYNYRDNYTYRDGSNGKGYYLDGNVFFGEDEIYGNMGSHYTRSEMSKIEEDYDAYVGHQIFYNNDPDFTTREEEIEMIASWIIDYPYQMASLLKRNGMSLNNMISRLKDESYRIKTHLELERIFNPKDDPEEPAYDPEENDIPFEQDNAEFNEIQRNIMSTLDAVKLITNKS